MQEKGKKKKVEDEGEQLPPGMGERGPALRALYALAKRGADAAMRRGRRVGAYLRCCSGAQTRPAEKMATTMAVSLHRG